MSFIQLVASGPRAVRAQSEGDLNLLAPAPQRSQRGFRGASESALGVISARLARYLSGPQHGAARNRLSISARLILLVLALALPLNLVIVGVIWELVQRANEVQRTSLLYAARSIAAGVDAELGKYVALAETLSRSPALLDENLDAFEAEARRAFPIGGDTGALVADTDGQQLLNPFAQSGQALPRRNPLAIAAQHRAFSTRSMVITDLLKGPLTQEWIANIEVPIFKDDLPFRGLAVVMKHQEFLRLLNGQDMPRNWLAGVIDGEGRFIARVPSAQVGQLASEGWRAIKDQPGLFEYSIP